MKKTSSNQPCGRDSEYINGAFLKSFSILCYLIVWGITLIFMVRLSFYAIPLLIYDVMNDITIIP